MEALERVGAELVFGYPGGNVVDIFDGLSRAPFKFVLGRHEQGCVHMADGYARASGRPAVVIVTSGPGLTNTITGLGAANMDGVPMVLVCGQVPLDQIGTDAFQEADTTGLTRAVSKHNFLVHSADEIPACLQGGAIPTARQICRSGDGEEAGLGRLESIGVGSARRAGRGKIEKAGGSVA